MSIRLRVTLTAVLVAAIALGSADFATYKLLSHYLDARAANGVREVAAAAAAATGAGQPLTSGLFAQTDQPVLVEVRAPDGRVLDRLGALRNEGVLLANLTTRPNVVRQLNVGDGPPRYEAVAIRDRRGRTVLAVTAVAAEFTTLRHVIAFNVWVGVIVLVLLAIAATLLLKRSLRPLFRIAATADAIAAGNLAERVPQHERGEIGRVSTAINRMLVEIEAAFAQRDATEQRLRQFLADASHELRTPLTSIRGYAELFRRGADRRPEDLAQAMGAIESEAQRMTRLVEDLLLLARLDDARPLERAPLAIDELVEEAVDAARVVDPDRRYGFELQSRPLEVEGDAARLRQVLDNLLANVRQHTPPGTSAYVVVRRDGDDAVLAVEDNGPGIDPADRERVFDRFFRPHDGRERDTGGAGLGLAIVRALVAAHGGTLTLHEARPHGARFELRLPLGDSRGTPRLRSGEAQRALATLGTARQRRADP